MEPKPLSMSKTLAIFGIVVGCFAVLYPRFFHPMILKIVGSSPAKEPAAEREFVPPHMRAAKPVAQEQASPRGGPHPGMRAAAEIRSQQQSGPGRGMIGVILPMYAVGIIVYLVYTLVKVFSSSKKDEYKSSMPKLNTLKNKYSYQDGKFQYRDNIDDNDAYRDYVRRKMYAAENDQDSRSSEEREMAELQKRLLETESQMARILDAMKAVSGRVDRVAGDVVDAANVMERSSGPLEDVEEKSLDQDPQSSSESLSKPDNIPPQTIGPRETETESDSDEEVLESTGNEMDDEIVEDDTTGDSEVIARGGEGSSGVGEEGSSGEGGVELEDGEDDEDFQGEGGDHGEIEQDFNNRRNFPEEKLCELGEYVDSSEDSEDNEGNEDIIEELRDCQNKMSFIETKIMEEDNLRHRKNNFSED